MTNYTSTYALPSPSLSEAPNVPADIAALAAGTETALGNVAALPTANLLINGEFDVNQLGASPYTFTSSQSGYTVDMWRCSSGSGATNVITQTAIATGSFADAPRYKLAWNRSVAGSANSFIEQRIEDVRTNAGKDITVSFNAAVASGTADITVSVVQNFGTGGSPSSETSPVVSATITVDTSTSTRRVATLAVPSISGKTVGSDANSYLSVRINRASGAGTGTVDFWDVQAIQGAVDRPVMRRPKQQTLTLCQHYLVQFGPYGAPVAIGAIVANGATGGSGLLPLPTSMRIVPTVTVSAANDFGVSGVTITTLTITGCATRNALFVAAGWASGTAVGIQYDFNNTPDVANAYIRADARL